MVSRLLERVLPSGGPCPCGAYLGHPHPTGSSEVLRRQIHDAALRVLISTSDMSDNESVVKFIGTEDLCLALVADPFHELVEPVCFHRDVSGDGVGAFIQTAVVVDNL